MTQTTLADHVQNHLRELEARVVRPKPKNPPPSEPEIDIEAEEDLDAGDTLPSAAPDEMVGDLNGYTVAEAQPLIEAETDVALLQQWADLDSRKGIAEAVARRLEELDGD